MIVFVEPFMRGSRTQSLISACCSLNKKDYLIVTRSDWNCCIIANEHLESKQLITIDIFDESNVWLRQLRPREFRKIYSKLMGLTFTYEKIIFMSVDEYFFLPQFVKTIRGLKNKTLIKCIWYRPPKTIGLKYFFGLLIQKYSKIYVYIETVLGDAQTLYDPWFDSGEQNQKLKRKIKQNYFFVIGKQTERKGLTIFLNAIQYFDLNENVHFRIIGHIPLQSDHVKLNYLKKKGYSITHEDNYLTEQELNKEILTSGIMVLPYRKNFDTTSGNLVRSSLLNVPLITSDHGFVGKMVKENKLGLVFETENPKSLSNKIREMIEIKNLNFFSKGLNEFKNKHNPLQFSKNLLK